MELVIGLVGATLGGGAGYFVGRAAGKSEVTAEYQDMLDSMSVTAARDIAFQKRRVELVSKPILGRAKLPTVEGCKWAEYPVAVKDCNKEWAANAPCLKTEDSKTEYYAKTKDFLECLAKAGKEFVFKDSLVGPDNKPVQTVGWECINGGCTSTEPESTEGFYWPKYAKGESKGFRPF